MPPAKHPHICINGRRLGDVRGPAVSRNPGTIMSVGFPANMHSCAEEGDALVVRTQLLTLLQLFVEGVLVADRERPVTVSVGRSRTEPFVVESILYDEDRWSRQVAVLRLRRLGPARIPAVLPDALLAEVREFSERSLAREFFESFNVNSKNFMQKSAGTETWIARFNGLARRVIAEKNVASSADAAGVLLDLLRRIDGGEDFIFFADEQGAFQVGADEAALARCARGARPPSVSR